MFSRTANRVALAWSVLLVVVTARSALAVPFPIPLVPEDFSNLGVVGPASPYLLEAYSYEGFAGTVASQAFDLVSGDYLYLYQVDNSGPEVVEKLVVFPFYALVGAGYLTGGEPSGFLTGGVVPLGATYDPNVPGAPTVGFGYYVTTGNQIPAGQHGATLYLISSGAPILGEAHVIDGGAGTVDVYVSPEPTAALLTAVGLVSLLVRRRRRAVRA